MKFAIRRAGQSDVVEVSPAPVSAACPGTQLHGGTEQWQIEISTLDDLRALAIETKSPVILRFAEVDPGPRAEDTIQIYDDYIE